jgi:hypothetical protein
VRSSALSRKNPFRCKPWPGVTASKCGRPTFASQAGRLPEMHLRDCPVHEGRRQAKTGRSGRECGARRVEVR